LKYKVLYVEDETETRKNICMFLKNNFDMIVFEASDGKEGFESYLENKPDILITDLNMEDSCGFDLIEDIRQIDTEIKIIILSAYSEQEKLLRAIRLNLVEYLIKPVSRKQLKEIINKTLSELIDHEHNDYFYFNETSYYNKTSTSLIVNNKNIKLTTSEIKILAFFIRYSNQILDSVDIFNHIWDFEKDYKVESVRTLVKKIRKKLPNNTIINVYGGGYKLVAIYPSTKPD